MSCREENKYHHIDFETDSTGMKTYEKILNINTLNGTPAYVERAFYYDYRGRIVQSVEKNINGGVDRTSFKYNFVGNILARQERITPTSGGNGTAEYTTYNLQGWTTAKNVLNASSANIFSQQLAYYNPQKGTPPLYTSNISEWAVTQGADATSTFGFSYDNLNRLTGTNRYVDAGTTDVTTYTEKNLTYDNNGNILTIGRYGASDVTPEDNFTYTYNGNKLVNLSGTYNGTPLNNANYRYDANGNMTHDGRKGIDITYDINNMPQTVSRNDTLKAAYTYLSDGTKEMVQDRTDNTSSNGYLYLGSMVFKKTGTSYAFESTDFGGGRIINVNGTLTAYYYITDHLGSVRAITDAGGNVVERNDYYPFGKNMTTGNTYPTMSVNRWKYNGKETQTTGEVNWLDYGARMYDEVIGRWTRVDPHANKYYNYSPYVYCLNNPLRYIDSIGKDGDVEINNNKIKISVSIYIYGSGASAQQATKMQTAIMTDWNRGFSYIDPETKQKYAVNFDVKVQVYDKNNPQKGPGLFSDKNNPFSTSNFIEVGATAKDINRSYVKGGDEGRWRGYGSDPSSHEFGHLIGLRDHYSDVNGIEADWKGNVMAEPAGKGEVEQKNIDAVASPLLNRYHKSGNKTQIFRTKIDENNPNW